MESGREKETDADLANRTPSLPRRNRQVDAQRLENIGAAALARQGAIAVFGHSHACARDDERGDGRDIEGRWSLGGAGATRIEQWF